MVAPLRCDLNSMDSVLVTAKSAFELFLAVCYCLQLLCTVDSRLVATASVSPPTMLVLLVVLLESCFLRFYLLVGPVVTCDGFACWFEVWGGCEDGDDSVPAPGSRSKFRKTISKAYSSKRCSSTAFLTSSPTIVSSVLTQAKLPICSASACLTSKTGSPPLTSVPLALLLPDAHVRSP